MSAAHIGNWPVIVPARLHNGVVVFNTAHLGRLLRGRHDCELSVIIERQHATRSIAQNAAYWLLYCGILAEHIGCSKDDVHEYLKSRFLPKTFAIADANGEIKEEFTVGTSTTRLNKIEFGEYMERIQRWAAESIGVVIPDPINRLDDRRRRA